MNSNDERITRTAILRTFVEEQQAQGQGKPSLDDLHRHNFSHQREQSIQQQLNAIQQRRQEIVATKEQQWEFQHQETLRKKWQHEQHQRILAETQEAEYLIHVRRSLEESGLSYGSPEYSRCFRVLSAEGAQVWALREQLSKLSQHFAEARVDPSKGDVGAEEEPNQHEQLLNLSAEKACTMQENEIFG